MDELPEDALDVPELPEDALVIRGGDPRAEGQLERMIERARVSYDDGGGYALSTGMGWDPSKTREELIIDIVRACRLPQRQLAVTTVGKVIESGMKPRPDGQLPCHANIDLGSEPGPELVEKFVDLFGPAEDNLVSHEFRRKG
jgi:hypothetical protein